MKRICCQCGKPLVPSEKCGKCGSVNVLQPVAEVGACRCLDCNHAWEKGSDRATHGICEECYAKSKHALQDVNEYERLKRVENLARKLAILAENIDICDVDVVKAKARELLAELGNHVAIQIRHKERERKWREKWDRESQAEEKAINAQTELERKTHVGAKLAAAVLAHNKGVATMERELTSYESEVLREKMCNLAREFQKVERK
jgi:ribosomal protein L40E